MKRITIAVPSTPILIGLVAALFLGMCISTFTAQIANGAAPAVAASGPLTGCVGNPSANGVKINLGGRVITPTTLLRLEPTGTCASNETSVSWNPLSDTQYVTSTNTVAGLVAIERRVYCPAGKQAISGGYVVNIDVNLSNNIHIIANAPGSDNGGSFWKTVVANFNDPNQPNTTATVPLYAICQTLAPGVHPPATTANAVNNAASLDLYDKPVSLKK